MDDQNKKKRSGCLVIVSALALVALAGWIMLRSSTRTLPLSSPTQEFARYDGG